MSWDHLIAAITFETPVIRLRLVQSLPQRYVRTVAQHFERNFFIVVELGHGEVVDINVAAVAQR